MCRVEITHPIEINADLKQVLELVEKNIKIAILTKFQRSLRDIEVIQIPEIKPLNVKTIIHSWDEKYTGLCID